MAFCRTVGGRERFWVKLNLSGRNGGEGRGVVCTYVGMSGGFGFCLLTAWIWEGMMRACILVGPFIVLLGF